jgi:hypothetical protein
VSSLHCIQKKKLPESTPQVFLGFRSWTKPFAELEYLLEIRNVKVKLDDTFNRKQNSYHNSEFRFSNASLSHASYPVPEGEVSIANAEKKSDTVKHCLNS